MIQIKLLGTGTSSGVPLLGCQCEVCQSSDVRDKRFRSSAMVDIDGVRILIDCGPDFRLQMLPEEFRKIDGILLTHEHYDHIGGIDDVRAFGRFGSIHLYGEERTCDHIHTHMYYCFGKRYPSAPSLELHPIVSFQTFTIQNIPITPIRVMHGTLPILGYRIGKFAYLTDVKTLPEESYAYLEHLDFLVLGALRHRPHDTHQTIEEAIIMAQRIGAKHTYFTHLAHSAGLHAKLEATLPSSIKLGYDGIYFQTSF